MSILSKRYAFLIPIVFGIASFFLVVGPTPLDPTNIGWLNGADPSTHYLGWAFFRYSPWSFPIGLNPNYGAEISSSIVYSDSIPLFAFFFKLFSPWLSEPFQYIGIWVLCCFILQAYFAWKLAELITDNLWQQLCLAGLLGTFAPVFLKRLGLHASLEAQFLILASLLFALKRPIIPYISLAWFVLLNCAMLINFYLFIMVLGIYLAFIGTSITSQISNQERSALKILLIAGLLLISCLLTAWIAGYFMGPTVGVFAEGYGQYKFNLLGLFDAGRFSSILKPIPHPEDLEEGFQFIGLGNGLIFLTLLFLVIAKNRFTYPPSNHSYLISRSLLIILGLFALFSITHSISLGPWTVTVPVPDSLINIAATLRSSGRFFWPCYYLILFFLVAKLSRRLSTKTMSMILGIALVVQIIDTSAGWLPLRHTFARSNQTPVISRLADPFWRCAAQQYQMVRVLPFKQSQAQAHWHDLAYFAAQYYLKTNAVYLARQPQPAIVSANNQQLVDTMQHGQFDPQTLYVFNTKPVDNSPYFPNKLNSDDLFAEKNGLWVLAPHWKASANCLH